MIGVPCPIVNLSEPKRKQRHRSFVILSEKGSPGRLRDLALSINECLRQPMEYSIGSLLSQIHLSRSSFIQYTIRALARNSTQDE